MNLLRASREFVITACIAEKRSRKAARVYSKLLLRFIRVNGNQDVSELSRLHLQLYLATELGRSVDGHLRPSSELRRECDLLLEFYKWLAVQGFIEPLQPTQTPSRWKGVFLSYPSIYIR
jgi:hypothetical protein